MFGVIRQGSEGFNSEWYISQANSRRFPSGPRLWLSVPPQGAVKVSLRGKGSSISCAAQRQGPPPLFPLHGCNNTEKGCISWPWKGPLQPCLICWHSQTKVNKSRVALADLLPGCCKQWPSPMSTAHIYCVCQQAEKYGNICNCTYFRITFQCLYWSWTISPGLGCSSKFLVWFKMLYEEDLHF